MSGLKAINEATNNRKENIVMKQNGVSICINEADNSLNCTNTMRQEAENGQVTQCEEELCKKVANVKINLENESLESSSASLVDSETSKDKKRIKHLVRTEAVRETSASPPPTVGQGNQNGSPPSLQLPKVHVNNVASNGNEMSSQLDTEATSSCLSRDSSSDNDFSAQEVQDFLAETMKSSKDRIFLLRVEQEMITLLKDPSQVKETRFADSSSYNRMLVHRLASYFGFEHVGDGTHSSVKVTKNEKSRMPELRMKELFKEDELIEEPKKLILKRDSSSIEDTSNGASFEKDKSPDIHLNGSLLENSRSRSLEEREEHYERVRARIFNQGSQQSISETNDDASVNNSNKTTDSSGATNGTATSLESEKPQPSCDKAQDDGTSRRATDTKADASPKLTESGGQKDKCNLTTLNHSGRRTTSNEHRSHYAANNNSNNQHYNDRRQHSNRSGHSRHYPRHEPNNYHASQSMANPLPYANAFPSNASYPSQMPAYNYPLPYNYDQVNQQQQQQQQQQFHQQQNMLLNPVMPPMSGQMNAPNPMLYNQANGSPPYGLFPMAPVGNMGYQQQQQQQQQQPYAPNDMMSYYGQNPVAAAALAAAANAYLSFQSNGNYQQMPAATAPVGLDGAYHNSRNSNGGGGGGGGHRSDRGFDDRRNGKNGESRRRTLLMTTPQMEQAYDAMALMKNASTPPYQQYQQQQQQQHQQHHGTNISSNGNRSNGSNANRYHGNNNEGNHHYQMYQQAAATFAAGGGPQAWHGGGGGTNGVFSSGDGMFNCNGGGYDDVEYCNPGGYNNRRRNNHQPLRPGRDANRRGHTRNSGGSYHR